MKDLSEKQIRKDIIDATGAILKSYHNQLVEIQAENAALKKRVAELEARLGQERGDERPKGELPWGERLIKEQPDAK